MNADDWMAIGFVAMGVAVTIQLAATAYLGFRRWLEGDEPYRDSRPDVIETGSAETP